MEEEEGGGGEGWSHRVEEEGGGERDGATVRRKSERGRGVVPPCGGRVREGERERGEVWSAVTFAVQCNLQCSVTCSAVSLTVQCHLL